MRTGHKDYGLCGDENQAHRGSFYSVHPNAAKIIEASLPRTRKPMSAEFRAQVRRLHRLGERSLAEYLMEVLERHSAQGWMLARLDQYSRINPQMIDAVSARDFPTTAEIVAIDGGKGRAA